jgi:Flp pilus assembly protein TadG
MKDHRVHGVRDGFADTGAISPMMLALLLPLLGLLGLATEASDWFLTQSRMQGAADAAVLAAALNGCDEDAPCHSQGGAASFEDEARAVAARWWCRPTGPRPARTGDRTATG